MTRTSHFASALLAFAALSSCTASRWYDDRFTPAPLEVQVETAAVAGAQVRTLVSVLGVERAKDGAPDRVVVRMRIENLGTAPATLVTSELELVTADLATFDLASVEPPEVAPIQAGESAIYDLTFPVPDGKRARDLNLRGLNLKWATAFGNDPGGPKVRAGASFQRVEWRRGYDDSPDVHVGFGFGVFHTH